MPIDQPTIAQIARILFEIADRDIAKIYQEKKGERQWRKETPFVIATFVADGSSPSVALAYWAFVALPDNYPSKKKYDPKTVAIGYDSLESIDFNRNKSIDDLLSHVLPYMPILL